MRFDNKVYPMDRSDQEFLVQTSRYNVCVSGQEGLNPIEHFYTRVSELPNAKNTIYEDEHRENLTTYGKKLVTPVLNVSNFENPVFQFPTFKRQNRPSQATPTAGPQVRDTRSVRS